MNIFGRKVFITVGIMVIIGLTAGVFSYYKGEKKDSGANNSGDTAINSETSQENKDVESEADIAYSEQINETTPPDVSEWSQYMTEKFVQEQAVMPADSHIKMIGNIGKQLNNISVSFDDIFFVYDGSIWFTHKEFDESVIGDVDSHNTHVWRTDDAGTKLIASYEIGPCSNLTTKNNHDSILVEYMVSPCEAGADYEKRIFDLSGQLVYTVLHDSNKDAFKLVFPNGKKEIIINLHAGECRIEDDTDWGNLPDVNIYGVWVNHQYQKLKKPVKNYCNGAYGGGFLGPSVTNLSINKDSVYFDLSDGGEYAYFSFDVSKYLENSDIVAATSISPGLED